MKIIKVLIIIDLEMKSNRETTVEHFDKQGIGWHEFVVLFYLLDEDNNPYKNIVNLDDTLSDTYKQDGVTVIALPKIVICIIIHELSFMKEAVMTSHNATLYQNHLLTFMMAIFNQKFNDHSFWYRALFIQKHKMESRFWMRTLVLAIDISSNFLRT